jgi:hypothetical protein
MDRLKEILGRHFEDGGGYDVEDFIYTYGDPKQVFLLFRIFWPQFMDVDGHVVLKTAVDSEDGPSRLQSLLDEGKLFDSDQCMSDIESVETQLIAWGVVHEA